MGGAAVEHVAGKGESKGVGDERAVRGEEGQDTGNKNETPEDSRVEEGGRVE